MPDLLMRMKLFVPPLRSNPVPRPQLIEQINQYLHLDHKLTLIAAPAGFGKTTVVAEWLEQPLAFNNGETQWGEFNLVKEKILSLIDHLGPMLF